ncbi:hypothetical protein [Ectobacillus ponti]|uniref:Uncharacterized protein n=1 Tax=Ectobacillus ponti TaxID=2961894 RepID=A0AA41X2N9_9BACI|nr:hypothetical protein [Ectobacillus ponti]MCP8967806.1 hypothetical protein [Ectobacillus ponti]
MKPPVHKQEQSGLIAEFLHSPFCSWHPFTADGRRKMSLHIYTKPFRRYEYASTSYFTSQQDAQVFLDTRGQACYGVLEIPDNPVRSLLYASN